MDWKYIQRLNRDQLRKLQNKRLRVLIKHSYDHVPYYHKLFNKENLAPDNIKTVDDLEARGKFKIFKTELVGKLVK